MSLQDIGTMPVTVILNFRRGQSSHRISAMRLSDFRCRAAVGNAACRHMDVPIRGHGMIGVSNLPVCCLQHICIAFSMKTLFETVAANIDAAQRDVLAMQNAGVVGN